jgi:hypothetical protein
MGIEAFCWNGSGTYPPGLTLDQLNDEDNGLTATQLDGLQNVINSPTGDTLDVFTNSDGNNPVHRSSSYFLLTSENKYGNFQRFTSATTGTEGRYWGNTNPITYVDGDLKESDGSSITGLATLQDAKTAFGDLIDDWQEGFMYSLSDDTNRTLSGGAGWGTRSFVLTDGGFDNWTILNRNQSSNIINADSTRLLGGPFIHLPFNRTGNMWTSTVSGPTLAYFVQAPTGIITNFFAFFASTVAGAIYVRDHR